MGICSGWFFHPFSPSFASSFFSRFSFSSFSLPPSLLPLFFPPILLPHSFLSLSLPSSLPPSLLPPSLLPPTVQQISLPVRDDSQSNVEVLVSLTHSHSIALHPQPASNTNTQPSIINPAHLHIMYNVKVLECCLHIHTYIHNKSATQNLL